MASSHQAHGCQQLQHQRLGPEVRLLYEMYNEGLSVWTKRFFSAFATEFVEDSLHAACQLTVNTFTHIQFMLHTLGFCC